MPMTLPGNEPVSFDRARVAAAARALAARGIFVGTSSWKYEGWLGQLYEPARYTTRGRVAVSRFEAACLSEYAETFSAVCVDAGFYRFPTAEGMARLADAVPDGFRFGMKVTEDITVARFPRLERYGARAGQPNPRFLDEGLFCSAFLEPVTRLGAKAGALIFEFSRLHSGESERGRDFLDALDGFLGKLPRGWQYAVEIRNPALFCAEYLAVLRAHGVAHVVSSWTRMPGPSEQIAGGGAATAPHFVARFLLTPGRTYEGAVSEFSPYTRVQAPDPAARHAMRLLVERTPGAPSFVFVNNRLEGSALGTIQACLLGEAGSG